MAKGKIKAIEYKKGYYRLQGKQGFFDSVFLTKKEARDFYKRHKSFVEKNTY